MKRLLILVTIIIVLLGGGCMFKQNSGKQIESIKSMSFGYSTSTAYLANVQYDINCGEKCIVKIKLNGVAEEDAKEVELEEEMLKEIIDFLNENKVYKWDGFQKSDKYVLDGNSFHFYLHEQNGRAISATGYMKYPKNYREVKDKIDKLFESLV